MLLELLAGSFSLHTLTGTVLASCCSISDIPGPFIYNPLCISDVFRADSRQKCTAPYVELGRDPGPLKDTAKAMSRESLMDLQELEDVGLVMSRRGLCCDLDEVFSLNMGHPSLLSYHFIIWPFTHRHSGHTN